MVTMQGGSAEIRVWATTTRVDIYVPCATGNRFRNALRTNMTNFCEILLLNIYVRLIKWICTTNGTERISFHKFIAIHASACTAPAWRLPLPEQSHISWDVLCASSRQRKQHFDMVFISHVNVCISNKRIICASLLPIFISIKVILEPNYNPINWTHALPFKFA